MPIEYRIPLQTDGNNKTYKTLLMNATHIRSGRVEEETYTIARILGIGRDYHSKLDPVMTTLATALSKQLSDSFSPHQYVFQSELITLEVNEFEINIEKKNTRYIVNTEGFALSVLSQNISRFLIRVTNEMTRRETSKLYYEIVQTPADIEYTLLNRAPFYFYSSEGHRVNVRLNVTRISSEKAAMEIMDGVWGQISFKELKSYLSFYLHGKKRGSWQYLSPKNLFVKLMKREPKESELKVMIAFLEQNRTSELVKRRAEVLLSQVLERYKKNLIHWISDNTRHHILVRGKLRDWYFNYDSRRVDTGGTQQIGTHYIIVQEMLGLKYKVNTSSVCIDNAQGNSPIADQLVTRLLVALNDSVSKNMVSTMTNITESQHRIADEYWGKPVDNFLNYNPQLDKGEHFDMADLCEQVIPRMLVNTKSPAVEGEEE